MADATRQAAIVDLTPEQAREMLARDGPNVIAREQRQNWPSMLLGQFKSPMVALLAAGAIISAAVGEFTDAAAIGAILVINGLIGFFQEFRAEKALAALRSMTAPRARVRRGGVAREVAATDVVVGDTLLLEAGDVVAADARLHEAHQLAANEAALTGESVPAEKDAGAQSARAALAERANRVFMGTAVTSGTAVAVVTHTGMATELGKIAHLLQEAGPKTTPLQMRLRKLSKTLLILCSAIVVIVAALNMARGVPLAEVALSAISLAVAAVPEGLPAIITIALALGVQRMAARNVLVRKLASVETLGSATVICTDKTGTLTTGVMTVRELWGPNPDKLLYAAAACCDARLAPDGLSGLGDTTEIAMLMEAFRRGIVREEIERKNPRGAENPFSSERKRMSIRRADGVLYVKGAVEEIQSRCAVRDSAPDAAAQAMAARGLRVLAVAAGDTEREENLRLLGLIGIADPPRSEAVEAVRNARTAGIRTVMITGDHPATAQAIATEIGILRPGQPMDGLVHARATAADKLHIVRALKRENAVVAMTGDGVNDAPALKESDVGIAMGGTGTEVTREAADMVLADDNFASIVAAVREGRGIYDNIRKALVYLLAGNFAELTLMLAAAVAGLPTPLLPLQLLWINLVTDGLPALALVTDPVDRDALKRPPRPLGESILGRAQWLHIVAAGLLQAACCFGVFYWALQHRDVQEARNLAFSVLVFGEVFRSFASRSTTKLFWQVGALSNLFLLAVVVVSVLVQIALHHIPAAQRFLDLGTLSLRDCLLSIGVGLVPVTALELSKLVRRAVKPHGGGSR